MGSLGGEPRGAGSEGPGVRSRPYRGRSQIIPLLRLARKRALPVNYRRFDGTQRLFYNPTDMNQDDTDRMFDKRVVRRNIATGRITSEDHDRFVAALPDVEDNIKAIDEGGDNDGFEGPQSDGAPDQEEQAGDPAAGFGSPAPSMAAPAPAMAAPAPAMAAAAPSMAAPAPAMAAPAPPMAAPAPPMAAPAPPVAAPAPPMAAPPAPAAEPVPSVAAPVPAPAPAQSSEPAPEPTSTPTPGGDPPVGA